MTPQPMVDTRKFRRVAVEGDRGDETNGFGFLWLPFGQVTVRFSTGSGWDHVSVGRKDRIPLWVEMCWIKDRFFAPEDCVVQFHPPASKYVNTHPNVLHLWRQQDGAFPLPWVGLV